MFNFFKKNKLKKNFESSVEIEEKKYHKYEIKNNSYINDTKLVADAWDKCLKANFQKKVSENVLLINSAMDSGVILDSSINYGVKVPAYLSQANAPIALIDWFGAQSFIGYQLCAILAQHWLIDKACSIPGKDAIRNGYKTTVNDGTEVDEEVLDKIRALDIEYKLNENCIQFVKMGRVFGIRIAMFIVDVQDPVEYYANPFNIDGVPPGSYRGISQIDPYWITPELDGEASADATSIYFYEPTWWRVQGMRVHRSHLIINRPFEVPDIIKPTYMYGGIPLTQKIYERVYAAERTANEAPLLTMTKRLNVHKVDLTQAIANQAEFEQRVRLGVFYKDNYGEKFIDVNEEVQQLDTTLSDLDAVIMTQYQIVAGIANIPIAKLMGITLKGFNTNGQYEEKNYHEEIKSIQSTELTALIERHHLLLIKSDISPSYPFSTCIEWNPLTIPTDLEIADINNKKADAAVKLASIGAIDGEDERKRIIEESMSGYNGLDVDELPDFPIESESNYEEIESSAETKQI